MYSSTVLATRLKVLSGAFFDRLEQADLDDRCDTSPRQLDL